ncbi:hypothetical protein AB1Y20_012786 [Prymnesium parvum]|uniref:Bifunctional lysine-specific demethylase and histidyl-hydroxylase n=1 Tax=Prymnesium parvum TaxID=97485 RepID=A0AB34IMD4_PRYPA
MEAINATSTSPDSFPSSLRSGDEALHALLSLPADRFFTHFWETHPLLSHGRPPGFFHPLLRLSDLDAIIHHAKSVFAPTPQPLRNHADASLLKRVATRGGEEWTGKWGNAESELSLGVIKAAFNAGFSLLLNEVQQRHRPVARLCDAIEQLVRIPCNANLYLTPAGGQAFETHFDWMDAIVLQLHGSKRWRLYHPLVRLPSPRLKYKPSARQIQALPPPTALVLRESDALFIPRGVPHDADTPADEAQSLHLTLGLLPGEATVEGLLHEAVQSLPPPLLARLVRSLEARLCTRGLGGAATVRVAADAATGRIDGAAGGEGDGAALLRRVLHSASSGANATGLRRILPLWRGEALLDSDAAGRPLSLNASLHEALGELGDVMQSELGLLRAACDVSADKAAQPTDAAEEPTEVASWRTYPTPQKLCEQLQLRAQTACEDGLMVAGATASVTEVWDEIKEAILRQSSRALRAVMSRAEAHLEEWQRMRARRLAWHEQAPIPLNFES